MFFSNNSNFLSSDSFRKGPFCMPAFHFTDLKGLWSQRSYSTTTLMSAGNEAVVRKPLSPMACEYRTAKFPSLSHKAVKDIPCCLPQIHSAT